MIQNIIQHIIQNIIQNIITALSKSSHKTEEKSTSPDNVSEGSLDNVGEGFVCGAPVLFVCWKCLTGSVEGRKPRRQRFAWPRLLCQIPSVDVFGGLGCSFFPP